MTGKIVIDDKTQKVVSAELDVDYKGWVAYHEKELAKVVKIATVVKRTLGMIGINRRPLTEADHKKLAAEKNAQALIDDFEKASIEFTGAKFIWSDIKADMDGREVKARDALADRASAKMAARMKEIEKEMERLNAEMKTLRERKAKLMDDIKAVTKAPRADFDKKINDMHTTLLKVVEQNADLQQVNRAARFIVKKK